MRVLITGASGGIGAALARALAAEGHFLLLQGRDEERLRALQFTLPESQCQIALADLTVEEDRQRLCNTAIAFGIDVLCNNAGINQFGAFTSTDVARIVEVNVTATMQLTQELLPQLLQQPQPRLIIIGSAFGAIGFPGYTAYCASKFALRGFAESLSRECADSPLRVYYLSPRATATTMNSSRVNALNESLGTATDTPEVVAERVLQALAGDVRRRQIGAVEAFQSTLNAIAPSIVDRALRGKLNTIKKHFKEIENV